MRPYQAEINRAASKIAEHQITLGDDKLLIQNGTKATAGSTLPGVRTINYTGMEPKVLPGRGGEHYLNYLQSQVVELYQVMNVAEDMEEKKGEVDPLALLFRAASQKKRFQRYVRRFERFLVEVARTYIKLAKIHMPEEQVVMAVGRSERVNISEFKQTHDLCYDIKLVPQSDDVETKFGKQITLNHALQYVGNKLEKEDIGKIMRAMPYGNFEESFSDLTLDYDAATNMILALDRGEVPEPSQYDNNVYMVRRLVARMRQADFKFLDPQIQQLYMQMTEHYEQQEVLRLQNIKAAQAEFIPVGGYMVKCDFYMPDPKDPSKTKRAEVPFTSLQWLIEQLETQGQSQEQLAAMNQGALSEMAQTMLQQKQMAQGNGMPQMPQQG
jgi:hypothetical protein